MSFPRFLLRAGRSHPVRLRRTAIVLLAVSMFVVAGHAMLPPWLQHIVGASSVEAALYRSMRLPASSVLYPRPPREAQAELADRIAAQPDAAELYSLRARTDEAALDFDAAERDWKLAAMHAKDNIAGRLELANYYRRRLATAQELAVLQEVAAAPNPESERYDDPSKQRAWLAYVRSLDLIAQQGLPAAETAKTYEAFVSRYPHQPAVYARAFQSLLQSGSYPAAEAMIARYRGAFPADPVFPIRAQALLEYSRGNPAAALAVYDAAYQPLWPADLIASYYALLAETHQQRRFLSEARSRLAAEPDGPGALNALTRIFYYDQQAGRLPQAQSTLDSFRIAREARGGQWSPDDLYTLATLELATGNYAEAARYNYALASLSGTLPNGEPAAQAGLAGLAGILLTAPEQPLALGSGDLTLYRDIATLDQGPGYWNGILSLWLNGSSPASEYASESEKAQSYFHRAKAAELLAELDRRFPDAPERSALHTQMLHALTQYGEPAATIAAGRQYLADFPKSPNRTEVGGLVADAYARQNNTAAEFALYDQMLNELAAQTGGLPFSAAGTTPASAATDNPQAAAQETPAAKSPAFALDSTTTVRDTSAAAADYTRLLDRYLGRLTDTHQLPQALLVLRHQLDRNPNDPALYERLATFLQQNNLTGPQEQVYKEAAARFQQPGWYDKLARFYLRQKNQQAFAALTRQVTDIFSGTDLDPYFARVREFAATDQGGPALALQLNLYAAKRFPHDLVFTRNLLAAYGNKPTADPVAYEALLRRTWFASDDLGRQFFEYLGRTGKLDTELAALQPLAVATSANPAATRELAGIDLWKSHFEQAAPLFSQLSDLYPADATLGDTATSLFRSAAYLDPSSGSTRRAAAIEQRLLIAQPDSPERLATLGDLYAEATATGGEDLPAAEPYWRRIPELHPGTPAGSLTAATIFWDYFQYDGALAEIAHARVRFHQPTLYGYEAGAIDENRHDPAAAVREYVAVVVAPPAPRYFLTSVDAAVNAFERPPSDAADSNLQSTASSLFNASEARDRLLKLATRPATAKLVDDATAAAAAGSTGAAALTLRADVLLATGRANELAPLLNAALARATTVEQAKAIGDLARTNDPRTDSAANLNEVVVHLASGAVDRRYTARPAYALDAVYEASLLRQAALSSDPVEKLQFGYQLADTLEARSDIPDAAKIIAAAYAGNPRVLGVVRATVDFYLRTQQPKLAIATLLEASRAATPQLARGFTLEAAAKANDAGDPAQGRALALGVLQQSPYDPQVLALVAASYARDRDSTGLRNFYLQQLDSVKTASLTRDERRADTALLRRGLIPALTGLNDFEGALSQYIALLSAYPEDSGTAQEAALYALRHGREQQLLSFFRTTLRQSPRDSRFAILLARTEATFEDLPAAIAAYDQAIGIRKDRADLYQGRVALLLRLGRTDPAAADYERLYLLTYKDPQWMVRLAELRTRQHRTADAVAALRAAYVDGRPAAAANDFKVAAQLLEWNLLPEARTFADRARALAGPTLLASQDASGALIFARILTRQGQATEALAALVADRRTAFSAPIGASQLLNELKKQGLTEDDAADFRTTYAEQRRQTIKTNFDAAVAAIGATVAEYQTPEQKLAYAASLDRLHATDAPLALAAAAAAGLPDREEAWRRADLLTRPVDTQADNLQAYSRLERRRLHFAELAQTLEGYAARLPPGNRRSVRVDAAEAWHDADTENARSNEIRLARSLAAGADDALRAHFLDLLLQHDPPALAAFAAGTDTTLADASVNYAVAHGTLPQAQAAIVARSRTLPQPAALWTQSNLAQAGLYLGGGEPTPQTLAAFVSALHPQSTIDAALLHPASPAAVLRGDLWFGFASRYGIALASTGAADAEDVLPALLEQSPTLPAPYVDLARTYAEAGNTAAALVEYGHAFELAPNQPGLHDEIGILYAHAGNSAGAIAEWRAALDLLRRDVQRNNYSESFYTVFIRVVGHIGQQHATQTLTPEIDAVLRPELANNGNYRSNELLEAVYRNAPTPEAAIAQLLSLSAAASDPGQVLEDLSGAAWLAPSSQTAILERRLQLAQADGSAKAPYQQSQLNELRLRLLDSYLAAAQYTSARLLLQSLPVAERQAERRFQRVEIVLAARTGGLPALLAAYAADPDHAPDPDTLTAAAGILSARPADALATRRLRDFIFTERQLANTLTSADFLALAQSRLVTGDLPGALELLRRLAVRAPDDTPSGEPGSATAPADSAAALLESTQHPAEAVPFLRMLTEAAPWSAGFRLRLGRAELATDRVAAIASLTALARDSSAPYSVRADAAIALAGSSPQLPGELGVLAMPKPSPEAARQPFYVRARLRAAEFATPSARRDLLREAIALQPEGISADRARLDLLQLTLPDPDPSFAFALLRNLQAEPAPYSQAASADEATESPTDSGLVARAVFPPLAATLAPRERVRLAGAIAEAFTRNHEFDSALGWALTADTLNRTLPVPDSSPSARVVAIEAMRQLAAANAARRPAITPELRAPVNVRAQLTLARLHAQETP